MKKGSIKNNRINAEVMRELACIIRDDVRDPRIDPFMTVTYAEVTPDLQFCKCHVSTVGSKESLDKTIEGLKNAEPFIRRELAHRVNLRKTPKIQFVEDTSIAYAIELSKKIDEVAQADARGAKYGASAQEENDADADAPDDAEAAELNADKSDADKSIADGAQSNSSADTHQNKDEE